MFCLSSASKDLICRRADMRDIVSHISRESSESPADVSAGGLSEVDLTSASTVRKHYLTNSVGRRLLSKHENAYRQLTSKHSSTFTMNDRLFF